MPDKILHKRSYTPSSKPTTSSLDPGELAINVNDGKAYLRKSGSGSDTVETFVSTNTVTSGSITISGSVTITGSLDVSGSITGSLFGTSSWAQNASASISSSYALSSSYTLFATSASYASSSTSASFAATASSADNFFIRNGATISGSINQSGSFTTNGTLTATTLIVQTITASIEFLTGSTKFGDSATNDTHQFTGSVTISGSLSVVGPITVSGSFTGSYTGSLTGSLFGTASWAQSSSNIIGGVTNYIPLWNSATTLSSSVMYQSASNIGINTTTPSAKLEVSGGLSITRDGATGTPIGALGIYANAGTGITTTAISFQNNGNALTTIQSYNAGGYFQDFIINTSTASASPALREVFRITGQTGNVGIGTAAPDSNLHISTSIAGGSPILKISNDGTANGSSSLSLYRNANDYATILHKPGGTIATPTLQFIAVHSATPGISFNTGLSSATITERVRINNSGSVGIGGIVTPLALLHVSASGTTDDLLIGTNKLFVSASGRVGIGTATPTSASLTVNGNIWATSITGSLFGTASYALDASNSLFTQTASLALTSSGITGGSANYLTLWSSSVTLSSSLLYQSSSTIGLNKTDPTYSLDISNKARIFHTAFNTANTLPAFNIGNGSTDVFYVWPGYSGGTASTKLFMRGNNPGFGLWYFEMVADYNMLFSTGPYMNSMSFQTNGTELLALNKDTLKVGIKTSLPASGTLHVNGNVFADSYTGSLFGTASWAQSASVIASSNTNAFIQGGNSFTTTATLGTNDNYPLAIETNGLTRLFITGSEIINTIQYLGYTTSSTTTITLPASGSSPSNYGLLENDLVIITSFHNNVNLTGSIPAGYTSTQSGSTNSTGYMWAYKFMGSIPDTTATNITGSTIAFAFRNVNRNAPINVSASIATNTTGMPDPPSITTTVSSSIVVALGFLDRDITTPTASAGYTLIGYVSSSAAANSGSIMASYTTQTTPGVVDPGIFTGSGAFQSDNWVAATFALTPITSSGNIGINNTNPLTTLHIGAATSTDFNLTNKAPVRISLPSFNTSASIIEALFIDHRQEQFASGSGAAIVIGGKAPSVGSFASRIINYTNITNSTGTRLQLQTQKEGSTNTWNDGILINELGYLGVNNLSPSAHLHIKEINTGVEGFYITNWNNIVTAKIGSDTTTGGGKLSLNNNSGTNNIFLSSYGSSYISGGLGVGIATPGANLVVQNSNGTNQPALGATGGHFQLQNGTYGLLAGVTTAGNTWIQSQRTDGTATAYNILLQSNGGNVGVGITSPIDKLHISGGNTIVQNNGGALRLYGNDHVYISWYPSSSVGRQAYAGFSSAGSKDFNIINEFLGGNIGLGNASVQLYIVTGSGNVGIGTTTPTTKLDISGSIAAYLGNNQGNVSISVGEGTTGNSLGNNIVLESDTTNNRTRIYNSGPSTHLYLGTTGTTTDIIQSAVRDIYFRINNATDVFAGTTAMYISSSGNVGIGTTTPSKKLEVAGDITTGFADGRFIGNYYAPTPSYYNGLQFNATNRSTGLVAASGDATDYIWFGTNAATERMRITNAGNVGIGTTTPTGFKLIVYSGTQNTHISAIGTAPGLILGSTTDIPATHSAAFGLSTATDHYLNGAVAGDLCIVSRGATSGSILFGIGYQTPTRTTMKIDITGSVSISSSLSVGHTITPSGIRGRIDAANDVVAYSTSDINFKTNIVPISNALEKIAQIGGYEFDWKEEYKHHHGFSGHDVGVIAQEIKKVLPEIVTTRESGYKAVKYEKIVPLLIEAIKEQQKQIENLQKQIDYLVENKQ